MKSINSICKLTGSCLCNQVKYSIKAEIEDFYFCHCQQCRKITGSAFAANIVSKPSTINWITGVKLVKHFDHPKRQFTKVFCIHCGSGLPYININKTALVIPAGSLDVEPQIIPSRNIFWDDKAQWYEKGTTAAICSSFPD
ncbi:MAG: GFA family protein [Alcanivoracaceae bacterium]|nr:GFA family protein [Alcanivoracaceae bacterium]